MYSSHFCAKFTFHQRPFLVNKLWSSWDFMCLISHILLQGQHPQQKNSFRGAITPGYEASEHRELRQEGQNQHKPFLRAHTNTLNFPKFKALISLQCFISKPGLEIFCDATPLCSCIRAERKKTKKKGSGGGKPTPKKSITAIVGYWIKQDYIHRRQKLFFSNTN